MLEWRNWQTHGTQNPAELRLHEGSTPSSSTIGTGDKQAVDGAGKGSRSLKQFSNETFRSLKWFRRRGRESSRDVEGLRGSRIRFRFVRGCRSVAQYGRGFRRGVRARPLPQPRWGLR